MLKYLMTDDEGNRLHYLYYSKSKDRYYISYQGWYLTGRKHLRDLLPIYQEFEKTGWTDREEIQRLKEKYRYNCKYDRGITRISNGHFVLHLPHGGKRLYCGTYHSLEEARQAKRRVLESDFKDIPVKRRKPYRKQKDKEKYIYQTKGGRWAISYQGESYGTFSTLSDAVEERDALIKAGWDYSELEAQEAGK